MIALLAALASCTPAQAAVADSVAVSFDTRRFVFIGSTHGDVKIHDFLLCLMSRPAFQRRVTDILVEWASPTHQRMMDRALLQLDPVPADSLRLAWFDTDYPPLWATLPQMPEFFEAVLAINARLPAARRIRVVGGNQPVDWPAVNALADLAPYPYKSNNTIHLLVEHLAPRRERRVLVVYGSAHNHHDGGTMMAGLEESIAKDQLYVIGSIHSLRDGERERVERFGDPDAPFFLRSERFPEEGPRPDDFFYLGGGPLASHIDAIVYLGPERDTTLLGAIAFTEAEKRELARRDAILGDSREAMRVRMEGRPRWFARHPEDFPEP